MNATDIPPKPLADKAAQSDSFDKERDHMHRRMLSSVSHDLKTPLASIIGSLEVYERLHDALPQEKQLALIHVALQEALRLDSFITNILDMARFENGLVKVQQENTEINALLRDCLTNLNPRLQGCTVERGASVTTEGMTDPVLLNRAVCLVLDNAVKYGGAPPVIHIVCGRDTKGDGFICISDKGRGIPLPQIENIFSKYTRLSDGNQQSAGTGLGLAICREIMGLLGGGIKVENSANGGAMFTLSFALP